MCVGRYVGVCVWVCVCVGGGVLHGRKVPACCETLNGERVLMAVDAFSVRRSLPDRICLLCEL